MKNDENVRIASVLKSKFEKLKQKDSTNYFQQAK